MIGFFRKIRKQLADDNRFFKYSRYAIGEIVLVVLGILIAVQINTWNENRKGQELAIILLKELKMNLEKDIEDMNYNISHHQRAIISAKTILYCFQNDLPMHDSLSKHFGRVPPVPQFLPTTSAYLSIQNEGVRIIRNDSLRLNILDLYEQNYVFLNNASESLWDIAINDYQGIIRKNFSKLDEIDGFMQPMDYDSLKGDMEYANYLNTKIGVLNTMIKVYGGNVQRVRELIDLIDDEF